MTETNRQLAATGHGEVSAERRLLDALLRVQAHRAAAQAVVGTVLGARVLGVELRDGPPPLGVVELGEADATGADVPDHGIVRLLAYAVAGPIAERLVGVDGVPLRGEPAYLLSTAVLALMREPDGIDDTTDAGEIARLLSDHFGPRVDDATEAVEHLAMNVEQWLCDHWGTIALVAAALLRQRRLAGDGVRRLMPSMGPGLLG